MSKHSFIHNPLELLLGSWLPYVTWILLIVSFVGIFSVAYYIYLSLVPSGSNASALKGAELQHEKDENELLRGSVKIWEYLSLLGYWPLDQMIRSFVKALNILREEFGNMDFLYRLPWFVIVGAQASGKTTLVEELRLPRPIGDPMAAKVGENPGVFWSF